MTVLGGRGGRPDDWGTSHDRARARAAERLIGPLDPREEAWLDDHLAHCPDCSSIAAEYATQRHALRGLRDKAPQPPRDLWARTAASIERESRHRALTGSGRSRGALVAPYALLAGALVVAVAVGSLTSSQLFPGPATTAPALAAPTSSGPLIVAANPTPLAVEPQDVPYVTAIRDGNYEVTHYHVEKVCPEAEEACATAAPGETRTIGPLSSPEAVYGSSRGELIVVGSDEEGSSVVVLSQPHVEAAPSPSDTAATATPPPSPTAGESTEPPASNQTPTPTPTASDVPTATASTVAPSPTPLTDGTIEIARNIEVLDTNAAYSPDGSAFAFTAMSTDRAEGPDVYVWHTGETEARAVTTDHRSVFGSWSGDAIVGSVVADGDRPTAFTLAIGDDSPVLRPEAGLVWRPAVDPSGRVAVYWAGTVARTDTGWAPKDGRLVLGRWSERRERTAAPTPLSGDQALERNETTIADERIGDWDARWDPSGTRLAVWTADRNQPSVGRLSLYVVDPFDGTIDLNDPPLSDEPALAGFAIADGRLAWAEPAGNSGKAKRVKILAWTDEGFGKVETATGDVLLVR